MDLDPSEVPGTVPELLRARAERSGGEPAIYRRQAQGTWIFTTWCDLWRDVQRIAAGLAKLGLEPGDRLAIVARTRPEWLVAEMAALAAGAVVVGIETHATAEQSQYVLGHCGARWLVADDAATAEKVLGGYAGSVRSVLVLDDPAGEAAGKGWRPWESLRSLGPDGEAPRLAAVHEEAPATLIYTSGTTGRPKGILYAHRQLAEACRAIMWAFPQVRPGDSSLAWLPMAHLFQRMMNLAAMAKDVKTYFVEDPRSVMDCIREVEPSIFVAVPRFYERLHEGIRAKLAAQPRWARLLAGAALRAGDARARLARRVPAQGPSLGPSLGLRLRTALLDRIVLRRVRRTMGRNIQFMITGSAPTPAWLLEFFHGIGLLVLEAYGISENTVPMAANRLDGFRFGSVGRPFAENEIRFADDGEILVRGPGVFSGYYRDEEQAACFTPEGFYATGDLGYLDGDGFLYLTGRKSEIIKTSTGRKISPARIEAAYARSPLIDQVVVIGNGRKCLVGLVVVRQAALAERLAGAGGAAAVPGEPPAAAVPAVSAPAVSAAARDLVRREIERLGAELAPHERIVDCAILPEPLSLARGEITPTLKIRRDRVSENYAELIERLYADMGQVSSPPDQALRSPPAPPATATPAPPATPKPGRPARPAEEPPRP